MSPTYWFKEILEIGGDETLRVLEEVFASTPKEITRADWHTLASVATPLATTDERWRRVAIRAYERASWDPATMMAWTAAFLRVGYIKMSGPDESDPLRDPEAIFDWVRELAAGRDPTDSKLRFIAADSRPPGTMKPEEQSAYRFGTAMLRALAFVIELRDLGVAVPRDLEPWLAPVAETSLGGGT